MVLLGEREVDLDLVGAAAAGRTARRQCRRAARVGSVHRDLGHRALERMILVGVHEDLGDLPELHPRDVGLGNLGHHAHVREVGHRHDDRAGVVHRAHDDEFAHLGVQPDHHAVHGAEQHGALPVTLGPFDVGGTRCDAGLDHADRALAGGKAGLDVLHARLGLFECLAADVAGPEQRFLALEGGLGGLQLHARTVESGLLGEQPPALGFEPGRRRRKPRREIPIVEADEHVALADRLPLAERQLHDPLADLRRDVDLDHRFDVARRAGRLHHVAHRGILEPDLDAAATATEARQHGQQFAATDDREDDRDREEDAECREESLHRCSVGRRMLPAPNAAPGPVLSIHAEAQHARCPPPTGLDRMLHHGHGMAKLVRNTPRSAPSTTGSPVRLMIGSSVPHAPSNWPRSAPSRCPSPL